MEDNSLEDTKRHFSNKYILYVRFYIEHIDAQTQYSTPRFFYFCEIVPLAMRALRFYTFH